MSEDTIPNRVVRLETKVLENCKDIGDMRKELKDNRYELMTEIRRIEAKLSGEIKENHKDILKIVNNDLVHMQDSIDKPDPWNSFKIIGALGGLLASLVIIIQNGGYVLQWLYDLLSVFFH